MSGGEVRKVSPQDIQLVQNLIEQCLPYYMSQQEVMNVLFVQEKIEPSFTELVWQKLEEQNQEFFKGYHLRLMIKEQIMEFNRLLGRQVELMHQSGASGVAFAPPMTNGSQLPQMNHSAACYAPENAESILKRENLLPHVTSNLQNEFTNSGPSVHLNARTVVDRSSHSRRMDVSPSMLFPSTTNMGMLQGMNGGLIKSEADYIGSVLERRCAAGDASVSPFSSVESDAQPPNETVLDENPSFALLGQISQNLCLSDLTADFPNSPDILENYSRTSFLQTDRANYLEPPHYSRGENQGDNNGLDSMSDGFKYEDYQ